MTTTGDLRHRVTFQKPPVDSDGDPAVSNNGFPLDSDYTDYVTVWAQVVGGTNTRILGKDFLGSGAIQSENQLMITIRRRTDITPDMRMLFDGEPYAIEAMVDKDGKKVWLDFLVKGWKSGGV